MNIFRPWIVLCVLTSWLSQQRRPLPHPPSSPCTLTRFLVVLVSSGARLCWFIGSAEISIPLISSMIAPLIIWRGSALCIRLAEPAHGATVWKDSPLFFLSFFSISLAKKVFTCLNGELVFLILRVSTCSRHQWHDSVTLQLLLASNS